MKWVNNTYNIEFTEVFPKDTGFYDVQFTVFNAGEFKSGGSNSTLHLTVEGQYLLRSNFSQGHIYSEFRFI